MNNDCQLLRHAFYVFYAKDLELTYAEFVGRFLFSKTLVKVHYSLVRAQTARKNAKDQDQSTDVIHQLILSNAKMVN